LLALFKNIYQRNLMNSSETQDDFSNIVDYVRDTGKAYWTEGFSFYLYGLIKMIKPKMVVEFGTGYYLFFGRTGLQRK